MITTDLIISNIFLIGGLFVYAIILHELGHKLYFKNVIGKDVDVIFHVENNNTYIQTGFENDYDGLTNNQLKELYLWGILLGIIPFLIMSIVSAWYIYLVPIYLLGCKSDIQKMMMKEVH